MERQRDKRGGALLEGGDGGVVLLGLRLRKGWGRPSADATACGRCRREREGGREGERERERERGGKRKRESARAITGGGRAST